MTFHLPNVPFLPAFPRRQPRTDPGNPGQLATDLANALAEKTALAEQLVNLRGLLEESEAARRIVQLERQLDDAWNCHRKVTDQLSDEHKISTGLRKQLTAARKQLDGFLYDDAALAAIDNGTGQPIRKG